MTDRVPRLAARLGVLLALTAYAGWALPALAAPGIALPGEPVSASANSASPTLVEAGSWTFAVGPGDNGHRYLRYHRVIPDSTVHLSVLASVRTTDSDSVSIAATTPKGDDCSSPSQQSAYGRQALAFSATLTVGMSADEVGQDDADLDPCITSDDLDLEIGRGYSSGTGDLDVALTVVEEAPVSSTTSLPAGLDASAAFVEPVTGTAKASQGGTLAEPTTIESGQAVTSTLRTGGAMVYRVPDVGWGQTLDVQVIAPPTPDVSYAELGVTILDPLYTLGRATEETDSVSESEKATATAVAGPVRYLNRYASTMPSIPGGYYYVVVGVASVTSPQDVDFTLKVAVTGKRTGSPPYQGGADQAFVTTGTSREGTLKTPGEAAGWTLARGATVAVLALIGVGSLGGGVTLLRRR